MAPVPYRSKIRINKSSKPFPLAVHALSFCDRICTIVLYESYQTCHMNPLRNMIDIFILAGVLVVLVTYLMLLRLPSLPPPGRLLLAAGLGAAIFLLLGVLLDVIPRKR